MIEVNCYPQFVIGNKRKNDYLQIMTWSLYESAASIGKALQGEAIVNYASP